MRQWIKDLDRMAIMLKHKGGYVKLLCMFALFILLLTYLVTSCGGGGDGGDGQDTTAPASSSLCSETNPTTEQIQMAVISAIDEVSNPWGDINDFVLLINMIEAELGCELRDGESNMATGSTRQNNEQCADFGVGYCGPGDSTTNLVLLSSILAPACLNEACCVHDNCYGDLDVAEECIFTPQSLECDNPLIATCLGNGSCSTLELLDTEAAIICAIALCLDNTFQGGTCEQIRNQRLQQNPECSIECPAGERPCGSGCIPDTSTCCTDGSQCSNPDFPICTGIPNVCCGIGSPILCPNGVECQADINLCTPVSCPPDQKECVGVGCIPIDAGCCGNGEFCSAPAPACCPDGISCATDLSACPSTPSTLTWMVEISAMVGDNEIFCPLQFQLPFSGGTVEGVPCGPAALTFNVSVPGSFTISGVGDVAFFGVTCTGSGGGSSPITETPTSFSAGGLITGTSTCTDGTVFDISGSFTATANK